jgi:hypothetical protein
MESLSNETTYKKNYDVVRLYKPPTSNEMVTEGIYFSLPNDCSSEIMRHLGHYFLYLLILVNSSFYKLLTRSLENGPFIFGYCNGQRIDSELLKGLYEADEAYLNQHKAKFHRGEDIPLCSMIMCSTEWPDIDPRKLHLFSLVNPKYPNTIAFRIFWCGNITSFDYILFNTDLTSYGILKWRDENEPPDEGEDNENEFPDASYRRVPFCFDFSLEEHGHLNVTVVQLESELMSICVLPEFDVLPESLCSTNTLGTPMIQFSVILRIDQCKNLIRL